MNARSLFRMCLVVLVTAGAVAAQERGDHPDAGDRAIVLFDWVGHGLARWSCYPAYVSVAESLLMRVPIADIRHALDSPDLSETKLEGAARFLAGWEFRSRRRSELVAASASTTISFQVTVN